MSAQVDFGMLAGTEWAKREAVRHAEREQTAADHARLARHAPKVEPAEPRRKRRGKHGAITLLLECGHGTRQHWTGATWHRCEACLSTELLGPYLCARHEECRGEIGPEEFRARGFRQFAAECWGRSDSPIRPTVALTIACRLVAGADHWREAFRELHARLEATQ